MKLIAFVALTALTLSSHAVQFNCSESNPNSPEGLVGFKANLNEQSGRVELSGDGIYLSGPKREVVTFFRKQRQDEANYSFAKYTGGSLFHLFFFSLPKKALTGNQQSFTAYLNFLREGVGGMAQFKLSCSLIRVSEVMTKITAQFNNLVTYEILEKEGYTGLIESISSHRDLPKTIQKTLNRLKLNIYNDWDTSIERESPYVINFSKDKYESDAIRIVKDGQTQGYVFNVTECNVEECYGWEALYLDAHGLVLEQSF